MDRKACPTSVSTFCCASTTPALRPARSTSGISGDSASCTADGAAAICASPCARPCTVLVSVSELSRTSGNAFGLPTSACDTALARRCDCISACPLAATWAALLPAEFSAVTVITSRPTTPASTTPPRMRCCTATGRRPIHGRSLAPEAAASLASGSSRGRPQVGRHRLGDDRRLAAPASMREPAVEGAPSARKDHRRAVRAWPDPKIAFVERRILPRHDRVVRRAAAPAPSPDSVKQTHRCLVRLATCARRAQPTILRNASWWASSDRRSSCQSRPVASRKRPPTKGGRDCGMSGSATI